MTLLPLLPSQAWFMDELWPTMLNPNKWNGRQVIELPDEIDSDAARTAVEAVWRHHDALRATFHFKDGGWRQCIAESGSSVPFRAVDLSRLEQMSHWDALRLIIEQAFSTLHVTSGPLVRFLYIRPPAGVPPLIVMVLHHMVYDHLSLAALRWDIEAAVRLLQSGDRPKVPRGPSYEECVLALAEYAASDALADELSFWEEQSENVLAELPRRHGEPVGTPFIEWSSTVLTLRRTTHTVADGEPTPADLSSEQVLRALVADAVTRWADGAVCVRTVQHGRDLVRGAAGPAVLPPRAWRVVGWFSTTGLMVVTPRDHLDPLAYVQHVSDRATSAPNQGMGASLLRWMAPDHPSASAVHRLWAWPAVTFNYVGFGGAGYAAARRPRPSTDVVRRNLDVLQPRESLYIRAAITADEVTLTLDYDLAAVSESTIAELTKILQDVFVHYSKALGAASVPSES